jgi:hypothetical protein
MAILSALLLFLAVGGPALQAAEPLPQDVLDAQQANRTLCQLVNPLTDPPVIVIGSSATASEQYAASELAWHLEKITGQAIKVVGEGQVPRGAKTIAVGQSKLTAAEDVSSLGVEQYIIDIKPEGVVIVGGRKPPIQSADGRVHVRDRGTLYGVYDFLEGLGVRWYRPEPWGWFIPKKETIELPVGKKISKPPVFIGRGDLTVHSLPVEKRDRQRAIEQNKQTDVWTTRQRINLRVSSDPKFGGVMEAAMTHAHARIIPPERYLKSHPEYFALVDGIRGNPGTGKLPQLCLGNTELQNVFAQRVIEIARANPDQFCIAVDPEDGTQLGNRMCTCPLCIAMDDLKHPQLMSNRVFAFTNIIARKLAKAVPGAKVGLYAYSMHTEPPTLFHTLEPNVVVALANINSWTDWSKPMLDPNSPQNAKFVQLAREWKAISPHKLWMREYAAYGWIGPVPMYRLLQKNIQAYEKMGMEGIDWPGEANWGPQMLLLYFKAQLQWNPDLDVAKELDLFYKNYYGPAAAPMKAYYETWMNAFENSTIGSGMDGGVSSGGRGMHVLCSPGLMEKLGKDIQTAQKRVQGNNLYERRLKGAALGYEVCRRVGDILAIKLADGTPTTRPGRTSKYLKSPKAAQAWEAFTKWLAESNQGDINFHLRVDDGSAIELNYMKRDILANGRYGMWNERALLKSQGFKE